jgi:hypothetical protein
MVFIVCLYLWDHRCDNDFIENILAVYDTLEKAVDYTCSLELQNQYHYLEIEQIELHKKLYSFDKHGKKIL